MDSGTNKTNSDSENNETTNEKHVHFQQDLHEKVKRFRAKRSVSAKTADKGSLANDKMVDHEATAINGEDQFFSAQSNHGMYTPTMMGPDTMEGELNERRKIFRAEMFKLGEEVARFKSQCEAEKAKYEVRLQKHRALCKEEIGKLKERQKEIKKQYDDSHEVEILERESKYFSRNQELLDLEQKLLDREEEVSQRQKALEEYDKEITEIEGYLDRRRDICKRKEEDLKVLDEELTELRDELRKQKEDLGNDGADPEAVASNRAKLNWDFVKKGMVEKTTILESALKRQKADLAKAENTIADQDKTIAELNQKITDLEEETRKKNQQVKLLNSQLTIALGQINNKFDDLEEGTQDSVSSGNTSMNRRRSSVHPRPSAIDTGNRKISLGPHMRSISAEGHLTTGSDRVSASQASLSSSWSTSMHRRNHLNIDTTKNGNSLNGSTFPLPNRSKPSTPTFKYNIPSAKNPLSKTVSSPLPSTSTGADRQNSSPKDSNKRLSWDYERRNSISQTCSVM